MQTGLQKEILPLFCVLQNSNDAQKPQGLHGWGKALQSLKDRVSKHKVPELLQNQDLSPGVKELTTHFLELQNSLENLVTGILGLHLIKIKHFHVGGTDFMFLFYVK